MHIRLWHAPYNGGWIWFDRKQWNRIAMGWTGRDDSEWPRSNVTDQTLWWCICGFCGSILLQTWPWQRRPNAK